MADIERPTAIASDHQCGPRTVRHRSPIRALKKCPAIIFLGCEKGTSGKPNTRTQVAPNEPKIRMTSKDCASSAMLPMARLPPIPARAMSLTIDVGGKGA
jgi:hypothetical protein